MILVAGGLAACLGATVGGPVGAVATGAYGGLAVRTVLRWQSARNAADDRVRRLDSLCALAADLRAGLPVPAASSAATGIGPAPAASAPPGAVDRLATLTWAAFRLAERTGAPLADLVERVEADARAMDRALAGAAAQAAGARATAWLLAGLPLGGIALGYGIGVDPLAILLHTPIGAGCAVGAVILQFAGLAWADRLTGNASRVA
jgi:tight adherence protein B